MRKVQSPLQNIIASHAAKIAIIRRFAFHAHRLLPSLERNTRLAKRALNAPLVVLDIIDGSKLAIARVAGEGNTARRLALRERDEGYVESILQTQTPLIVDQRNQQAQLLTHPVSLSYGVAAYIAVPIVSEQGIPVGLLVALDEHDRLWNESDVATLHDCAEMIVEIVSAEIASRNASPVGFLTQDALMAVSELLQEGIIVADRQDRLVYANQRIVQLSGYDSEELMTSPTWSQLTQLEQDLQAQRAHQQQGQDNARYVLELVRKDGSHWWAEVVNKPLYDTIGNPLGTIRLFSDITEHQQLVKHTLQLQRQDIIGQITLGITHDFNNLLTIVLGSTQLAMMEVSEDQQLYHDLDEIYQATNRASRITRQILAFARNQSFEPSPVDINELMVDVAKLLRRIIYSQIEIIPLLDPEASYIEGDIGYLEQLLLNLALNARDLMPQGGKLFLETHALAERTSLSESLDKPYMGITIRSQANHNLGHFAEISDDTLEHIQLRFSIAKHITEQHQGELSHSQDQHQDMSYHIRLPINESMISLEDQQASMRHLPRGKEHILVVEHEPSMRRLLARLLSMCDYEVEQAHNADDARQLLQQSQQPFDLIVTDTTLPYISGQAFIRQLHSEQPQLKVLFTSSFHDNDSLTRDYPSGKVMFLAKPFLLNDLAYKVRELLDS
jgi:two-component system cell cycle sensor histidine kinase/response regulator CckA